MLQPWRKQVSSVAELVLAFIGPFAIIRVQTIRNPAPPSHRTPTFLNTFYPKLYNCSSLGLPRPSSVLWTDDLLSVPCRKAQTALDLRDPRFLHRETLPHSRVGSTLALRTTCSAWHALPLKCHISHEASTSNPVRTNPPFTHMPIDLCSTHLEFYSFYIPT